MAVSYLSELAQQLVAEQGYEATEHLAEAIRAQRAVGDNEGAKLLTKIARQIEQLDAPTQMRVHAPGRANRRI